MLNDDYNRVSKIIKYHLESMTNVIRDNLSNSYNVENPESEYYQFRGLCNTASEEFIQLCRRRYFAENVTLLECSGLHGEQRHHPRLLSIYWLLEHTWVECIFDTPCGVMKFYVDPTSEQYSILYSDIPNYIVSNKPIKFYYKDDDNPRWNNRFLRYINDKILYKVGSPYNKVGIIEFLQYIIWGNISDLLHKIFYKG